MSYTGYNSRDPCENEVNHGSSHKLPMEPYNLFSPWINTFEANIKFFLKETIQPRVKNIVSARARGHEVGKVWRRCPIKIWKTLPYSNFWWRAHFWCYFYNPSSCTWLNKMCPNSVFWSGQHTPPQICTTCPNSVFLQFSELKLKLHVIKNVFHSLILEKKRMNVFFWWKMPKNGQFVRPPTP